MGFSEHLVVTRTWKGVSMRIKLRVARGSGRPSVDILLQAEASTPVGVLARYLSRADPDQQNAGPTGDLTLALAGSASSVLHPFTSIEDSGLHSGSQVSVVPIDKSFENSSTIGNAAVVRIIEGPDAGKEFSLAVGTSIIGRDRTCEVRLSDPLVSRQHAKLHITDVAEIVDLGSANGLVLGDDVTDRVILGAGDTVRLGDTVLGVVLIAPQGVQIPSAGSYGFNRPPRVEQHFAGIETIAPEPPDRPRSQRFPIIPLFAPLVIGLVIYLSTRSITSLLFVGLSPIMMIGYVVEGQLAGKKSYASALALFRSDVTDLVQEATSTAGHERSSRLEENPSVEECLDAVKSLSSLLWSRSPNERGFLELRLGLGRLPSRSSILLPQGKQSDRELWQELRGAIGPFADIDGVPVVARLVDEGALGVCGFRESALGVMRALIVQVSALHSPLDVHIAAISSTQYAPDWDWVKWLPHCAPATSPVTVSPLASSGVACDLLIADLERIVDERTDTGSSSTRKSTSSAAIVVIVEDSAPCNRAKLTRLAENGPRAGIYVLWIASGISRLPSACRTYVNLAASSTGDGAVGYVHSSSIVQPVRVEGTLETVSLETARALAPVIDLSGVEDGTGDLPRSVSLLNIIGPELAVTPEALIDRWTESRSLLRGPRAVKNEARRSGTLRAVLGQSVSGPYVLDLRAQGPHALVGGTTGSGKSELLQSWILGMATAHSPQRVTFLLIDYKGGSAFSECVKLPHTVGLVTDLSPHLVRRALISLAAELHYREELLHRKNKKDLLELERAGDPDTPPSLVIIVDEFAALVQEVPEFVDGVVNVAQRGRSLGLHLILATQRPAGVIKGNLRANTNLRLALRMADEADSTDVLGSPIAAAFDPSFPGRAVSKTGPSQFVQFQAAYSGGWTEDQPLEAGIVVETLGFGPSQLWELPQSTTVQSRDPGPTDIERLVSMLGMASEVAAVGEPRKPWLPPLDATYDLALLPTLRRDDALIFGKTDNPEHQSQPTIGFYPDREGNLAVFGTGGSGKSTLLRTLALASGFTVRGGPCQVYGIDFGARGLQMLEGLPHVGSIISGGDHERVTRLFTTLRSIIDERAVRFGQSGAGTITDYRRVSGNVSEPRILLLLDGMAAFRTAYEGTEYNRWFEMLVGIATDGRPVGIHLIVSADRLGAMPISLASHIQRRVVLRLADANDYSAMGLPVDVLDEGSPPGRGLSGDLEVQVAVLGGKSDVVEQSEAVRKFGESMRQAGAQDAPAVERLAENVRLEALPIWTDAGLTIGLSGATLGSIGFIPRDTFLLAGPPGSGRSTALITLISSLCRWKPTVKLYYFGNARSSLAQWNGWTKAAINAASVLSLATELPTLLPENLNNEISAVVVIESAPEFAGGPADFVLQDMIKKTLSLGQLVIGEGETSALAIPSQLLTLLRTGRNGIVLVPDQGDGNLLRSQFPRLRRADFPPGRGLLVSRGAQPVLVQVALPPIDFDAV